MRFIGNKTNLVDKIYNVLIRNNIKGDSIFDFFAGTSSVGKYYKIKNYKVFSSDLLYFSYVLQKAYIENNSSLKFTKLIEELGLKSNSLFTYPLLIVIDYLNNIQEIEGFIFKNYTPDGSKDLRIPRMFFSNENGKIIDSIRVKIEDWFSHTLINENEYFVLLACLIESVPFYANISGVYAAFHKKWDPRAVKKFELRPIETIINSKNNECFNDNSSNLLDKIEADIFYLDPPYNHRQYAPNYHILETIAKYDNPEIKGIAGLRDYQNQKSKFCNAKTGLEELDNICKYGKFKNLALSYNSEGVMPQKDIKEILNCYGSVKLEEFDYLRFKSNSNGESKTKKYIKEQLFLLEKK